VLAVQPGGLGSADEELAAVGSGSGVGHGHDSGSGVLEGEVLVLELVSVDGLAAGSVVVGEVAALAHEVGDDAVEGGVGVAEALLAGAQSAEVLGGLGGHVGTQLNDDSADGRGSGGDVEVDAGKRHLVFLWVE